MDTAATAVHSSTKGPTPVRIDGVPRQVVGVMPREFRFAPFWATRAELWDRIDRWVSALPDA
jgi:hypothetical protein